MLIPIREKGIIMSLKVLETGRCYGLTGLETQSGRVFAVHIKNTLSHTCLACSATSVSPSDFNHPEQWKVA